MKSNPITKTLALMMIGQATMKTISIKNLHKPADIDNDNALRNADQLINDTRYQEAYECLLNCSDQSSADIKWRKACVLHLLSKNCKDKNEHDKMIRESFRLIQKALALDDNNFEIHKWMVIILNAHAQLDGLRARIKVMKTLEKHMRRHVELNPLDPHGWHVLGSYEFSLADLSSAVKLIVYSIHGNKATGSYERALGSFLNAEQLKKDYSTRNLLYIGKTLRGLKRHEEAKKFLEKAVKRQVLNDEDRESKEEAVQLLSKF